MVKVTAPAGTVITESAATMSDTSDPSVRTVFAWCHYGGRRVWFCCPMPRCGRPVAVLYLARFEIACRKCLDLRYETQRQRSKDRTLAKARRIRSRSMQPVIIWDEQFGMRTISMMFWKFLPPYITDQKKISIYTLLARGDKLLKSSMWRESFQKRRCLVLVDSFIEWQRPDEKTKLPQIGHSTAKTTCSLLVQNPSSLMNPS